MQTLLITMGVLCEMELTPASLIILIVIILLIILAVFLAIFLIAATPTILGTAIMYPIYKLRNYWKKKSPNERKDILLSIWWGLIAIGFVWGCFNENVLPVPIIMMILGAIAMFVIDWLSD